MWPIIIAAVIGILAGAVIGFFVARWYMKKYFQDNPPISADMVKQMMSQMGQKPSQKKLNQVMASMKAQQKKNN
ncbi:YneF family protein [Companilactobacillus mishanensis]|uniref:YneF family protein n=1 Tax=Companilactobacillus mishanensis TaxID=2486008 RepID=A0A5P0ZEL3_9LACO|nr:YneF family protein [Companilactobacillus mishanensis]MQS44404.1 YneF family protein [Companilactobacillus mishanensis]MQS51492.1 YneF family protein [Companilactobacillus mishanensis]MQS88647.1 YneF family protein [Companilactobacillus mishanensis]